VFHNPDTNRPKELLEECQSKYGLDRHRVASTAVTCYYRTCEWSDEKDEFEAFWRLGGADKNPDIAITQAFAQMLEHLQEDANNKRHDNARHYDALVLVAGGKGKFIAEKDEWDTMTMEEKNAAYERAKQSGDLPKGADPENPSDVRITSCISLEGIATELCVFFPENEHIEFIEQWTGDGEGTIPHANNELENGLLMMFTFTQLLRETVRVGRGLGVENVLKTAMEIPEEAGGRQMASMFIQMIGAGVETGLFDSLGWGNAE